MIQNHYSGDPVENGWKGGEVFRSKVWKSQPEVRIGTRRRGRKRDKGEEAAEWLTGAGEGGEPGMSRFQLVRHQHSRKGLQKVGLWGKETCHVHSNSLPQSTQAYMEYLKLKRVWENCRSRKVTRIFPPTPPLPWKREIKVRWDRHPPCTLRRGGLLITRWNLGLKGHQ